MLHVPFGETLQSEPKWETEYDVEAWRSANYEMPLREFRFDGKLRIATRVDPGVKEVLKSRVETFGEHPTGLGRFTRTMFANDFRRQVVSQTEVH